MNRRRPTPGCPSGHLRGLLGTKTRAVHSKACFGVSTCEHRVGLRARPDKAGGPRLAAKLLCAHELASMVGTSDEGSGENGGNPRGLRLVPQLHELFRVVVANDGVV